MPRPGRSVRVVNQARGTARRVVEAATAAASRALLNTIWAVLVRSTVSQKSGPASAERTTR
jgi:hypothetical protein